MGAMFMQSSTSAQGQGKGKPSPTPTPSPAGKISTPTISCNGSTKLSINVLVTAGATGAPAGFSLQWLTTAAYALGPDGVAGTPDDNSWPLSEDTQLCKASFSGNANLSRYNLGPGESVSVNVGEFLIDAGASTNCGGSLVCGTDYVFRAFSHATNTMNRSDFTANLSCSTLPCEDVPCNDIFGCTRTQGYWKTHGPIPTGNNSNEWSVANLLLGTTNYTDLQLQSIFDTAATGNGLIALAHQLIAAKLNQASPASVPPSVATCISNADALIGNLVVPPVGAGFLAPSSTSALTQCLADYNEGVTGPGHCEDPLPQP